MKLRKREGLRVTLKSGFTLEFEGDLLTMAIPDEALAEFEIRVCAFGPKAALGWLIFDQATPLDLDPYGGTDDPDGFG